MDKKYTADELWKEYQKINPMAKECFEAFYFCSDCKSANNLLDLVLKGEKRGTSSLLKGYELDHEPMPKVGDYSVVTDFDGNAYCVIKTIRTEIVPFNQSPIEFSQIEGEGDKSFKYWHDCHVEFFSDECKKDYNIDFSEDMEILFEEFEVVYQIERR